MRSEPAKAKRRAKESRAALVRALAAGNTKPGKLLQLAEGARTAELLLVKAKLYHAQEDLIKKRPEYEIAQIRREIDNLNDHADGLHGMTAEGYISRIERETV